MSGQACLLELPAGGQPWNRTRQSTAYQTVPVNQLGRCPLAEDGGVEPRAPRGTPLAFKARCRTGGASSIDFEEGGRLERHGVTRASASNGARRPVRFTFRALGGSRTLTSEDTRSWGVRGCQLRHQRLDRRIAPGSAKILVCSAGVEPATDGYSSRPLYRSWSTSTRAAARCRPGSSAVRKRSRSRARRRRCLPWI